MSLNDVIRRRVMAQNMDAPQKVKSSSQRFEILNASWWISSKHGLQSRAIDSSRYPTKRVLREGAISSPIAGTNRIFTLKTLLKLFPINAKPSEENDLIEHLKSVGSSDRNSISVALQVPRRKLDYMIRRELKNWNLIKLDDIIWDPKTYFTSIKVKIPSLEIDLFESVIIDILGKYPFLSLDQISFLSGIHSYDLSRPISNLHTRNLIERGKTRKESPDEYFVKIETKINERELNIDWTSCPIFVLDKYDPLVEIIKLERFFMFDKGDYWLFVDGIPQAEFKLTKSKNTRVFKVHSFQRLMESEKSLGDLLEALTNWATTSGIQIKVDLAESVASQFAIQFIGVLKKRGYQIKENTLTLRIDAIPSSSKDIEWKYMGQWYREQQYFRSTEDPSTVVQQLVQLNEPISLGIRLNKSLQEIKYASLIYTTGINYQLGLIHVSHLPDIISGWPKDGPLTHLDRTILAKLETLKSTHELANETNRSEREVIQRLRYLELNRYIRRDTSHSSNFHDIRQSSWKLFNTDFPESLLQKLPIKGSPRSFAAVGNVAVNFLKSHVPLTSNQLSKYLGITNDQMEEMKNQLIRSGKIIEGYFIKGIDVIQLTTGSTLDSIETYHKNLIQESSKVDENQEELSQQQLTIESTGTDKEEQEEEYIPSSHRLDLIPSSDPLFQLHLSNLMLSDDKLIIKKRIPPDTKYYMINWDGAPVGYIILLPNSTGMFDYDMELKLRQTLVTNPIISATLEQIILISRNWFNDEIRLMNINDIFPSDSRYELLHFFFDSIGLEII